MDNKTPSPTPSISLKEKDIIVDENDNWPCTADSLGRDLEISNLNKVLMNVEAPFVFALDAPWGAGKTTFVKLWQHYLKIKHNDFVSIYFNAWDNDFNQDPLIPILSEIEKKIDNKDYKHNEAIKKLKKILTKLFKSTLKASVKAATYGLINIKEDIESALADGASDLTQDLLEQFEEEKNSLKELKEILSEVISSLPNNQKNLFIFVDELDRCRPSYAVEMLERIKHIFDLPNIVFILSVNKDQLSKSVQGVYGSTFDGMNYLKRFIDLEYHLKNANKNDYIKSFLLEGCSSLHSTPDDLPKLVGCFCELARKFDLTMRDIQQILSRLKLILMSNNYTDDDIKIVIATFLVLRHVDYDKYKSLQNKKDIADLISLVSEDDKYKTSFYQGTIIGVLIKELAYDDADLKYKLAKPWDDMCSDPNFNALNNRGIQQVIANCVDRSKNHNVFETVFNEIELFSSFEL